MYLKLSNIYSQTWFHGRFCLQFERKVTEKMVESWTDHDSNASNVNKTMCFIEENLSVCQG